MPTKVKTYFCRVLIRKKSLAKPVDFLNEGQRQRDRLDDTSVVKGKGHK